LLLSVGSLAHAQTGRITVESKPSGATVFIDSLVVGKTPLSGYNVAAGAYRLRLIVPSTTSWLVVSKTIPIEVHADQELQYTVDLGSVLTLSTKPSGASVFWGNRQLGTTPLFYRSANPLTGTLLIKKEGFEPAEVLLAPDASLPPPIELKPLNNDLMETLPEVLPPDHLNGTSPRWATYAAASTMILSGVLSAYWKDQANRDFDQYTVTKNPALLASTERLDRRSGIAITVSHLSFALLAYLLLSD
jgi:hypothetical protein